MIAVTPALHLLVAISMTALAVDPSACAADDLHCSARAFTSAARRAKSDAERVEYLYFASRAYLALSETPSPSPASRDLCQAKQLIDQAVALPATELRERVNKSRQETRTRLKRENIRCRPPKLRAKDDHPLVALAGPQAELEAAAKLLPVTPSRPKAQGPQTVPPTPEAEAPGRTPEVSSAPSHAEDPRATVEPEAEASARTSGASLGVPTPTQLTPTTNAEPRSGETRAAPFLADRRRFRAGLGTLIPGLLLFAPVAGLLTVRGAKERELKAFHMADTSLNLLTAPERARIETLNQSYRAATAGAVVLGVTGAALAVAGVVLMVTGKQPAKLAVSPWGGRGISGLVIEGRF